MNEQGMTSPSTFKTRGIILLTDDRTLLFQSHPIEDIYDNDERISTSFWTEFNTSSPLSKRATHDNGTPLENSSASEAVPPCMAP